MLLYLIAGTSLGALLLVVIYGFTRGTTPKALRKLLAAEGDDIAAARTAYWSLTRRAQWIAVGAMTLWILSVGIVALSHTQGYAVAAYTITATGSLWALIIIATSYNEKESSARWDERVRRINFRGPF